MQRHPSIPYSRSLPRATLHLNSPSTCLQNQRKEGQAQRQQEQSARRRRAQRPRRRRGRRGPAAPLLLLHHHLVKRLAVLSRRSPALFDLLGWKAEEGKGALQGGVERALESENELPKERAMA